MDVKKLSEELNAYLKRLRTDYERKDFLDDLLDGLEVCKLCGSLHLPCYCASQYDE